ncbi:Cof-type HAD-IIB family hydrolase [Arthrobacter sp. FW306-05-C]|uniref:HAD hydrolase family protein n=1 Tax=Arthrobacter TaxID=1663 RepID=UPI001EF15E34|nr:MULTISPECIES: HAD family hydrolase [Arthrobacter]MDP9986708.1 Cof subfamily protein (haloacid dehalogenase superfamily) [Arthrobacter oryzae]UKA67827.1 Cof-type HAD-IIB family hydrolase [Arthrobacter sp. FW306-05-C]UKA72355.1 Cof-type HAD-IIB family hydrolase [Arthrobacter sp. FW306-06-A]UKA76583.1 Cof-type HAD-IIB family hydrolase [Arthrobacter sp. FW306-07-I]
MSSPTARPRAIFLDIDGTYADHGLAPEAHVDAVRAARKLGHLVFVCTGRPLSMVPGHILDAGFDGTITGAGARVEVNGEVLKDARFEPDLAARIVEILDSHNAAYILEAPEALHGRTGVDRRLREVLGPIFAGRPQHDGVLSTDVDPLEDILGPMRYSDDLRATSYAKISCFDSPVPLTRLLETFGPEVGLIPSSLSALGERAGEIFMAGTHKAVGIQVVQARLRLDRADIVAIGDSANDIEMLEYAGVGIAVEGGHPAVLAVADRVTAPPAGNGVALAFAELGLLG